MLNWLDSLPINLLSKDLEGLWTRQQAISDNIANVSTPGYKSKVVSFEDQLKGLLADPSNQENVNQQIKDVEPSVTVTDDLTSRLDGNNVDVEQQNVESVRTQFNYMYSLRELSSYFSRLKYVITEGKS